MKLEEIYIGGARSVYLENYLKDFNGAIDVATLYKYILKKNIVGDEIFYGLFDEDSLVSYLKLEKYNDKLYQVRLSQVEGIYKGHGYGTALYDYAIMNDKIYVLSDLNLTKQSQDVWDNFQTYSKFKVVPYNIKTNTEELDRCDEVYSEEGRDELVWLAIPGNETINEALARRNYGREEAGKWIMCWYGPEINGEY